jgi:thioredoxin-like negative regulator of GroEL
LGTPPQLRRLRRRNERREAALEHLVAILPKSGIAHGR